MNQLDQTIGLKILVDHFKAIQNFTKKPHGVGVILVGVETSFEEKADGLQVVSLKLLSVGEQVSEDDCDVHVRLPVLHAVVHLALGRDHADKVALVSVDLDGESLCCCIGVTFKGITTVQGQYISTGED